MRVRGDNMLKTGRWARKWDACRECHSSETAHYAKGLCSRCYMRLYKRSQRRAQRSDLTVLPPAPGLEAPRPTL